MNKLQTIKTIGLIENSIELAEKNLKKSKEQLSLMKSFLKTFDTPEALPETVKELLDKYEKFTKEFYNRGVDLFEPEKSKRCKKFDYVYLRKCFFKMAIKHYNISSKSVERITSYDHASILYHVKKEVYDDLLTEIERELKQNNLYYD